MTVQFSKCQEAELARMEFFKVIFFKMQGILDLTKTDRSVCISEIILLLRKYIVKIIIAWGLPYYLKIVFANMQ